MQHRSSDAPTAPRADDAARARYDPRTDPAWPARLPSPRAAPPPTKVSKPFPWGVVAGSAVLALFLGGILFYAATNQGAGQDKS